LATCHYNNSRILPAQFEARRSNKTLKQNLTNETLEFPDLCARGFAQRAYQGESGHLRKTRSCDLSSSPFHSMGLMVPGFSSFLEDPCYNSNENCSMTDTREGINQIISERI
jgi:hypothetical protein